MTESKPQVEDAFALLNAPLARPPRRPPRSRVVYLVLGILFGWLGIHNWYARRTIVAVIQSISGAAFAFAMVVVIVNSGSLEGTWVFAGVYSMAFPVVAALWVLGDLIVVDECGDDVPLEWSA